jgi:hypothetical protein
MNVTVGLAVTKFVEEGGGILTEIAQGGALHWNLDGRSDGTDAVMAFLRPKQNMHMFGHDHIGPK